MEIEALKKYKAKVNYHRTDDLRDNVPPNGEIIEVEAYWLMDEDDNFPGEWAFQPRDRKYGYWLPQRDLEIIEKITE